MKYICSQCGYYTNELKEGYCVDCCNERQSELNSFNFDFDLWESLSDKERRNRIDEALD